MTEFENYLASKADVIVPAIERPGALSATEVLATQSWFKNRLGRLKSDGGRPTNPEWTIKRQIPFSPDMWSKLQALAKDASSTGSRIAPGQLAAFLLEDAVTTVIACESPAPPSGLPRRAAVVALPEPNDPKFRDWEMPELFSGHAA